MRILLLLISLFFSGCSQKTPPPIKEVLVEKPLPRMTIFYSIPNYEIIDYRIFDEVYYLVNRKQLHKSSSVSQKKTRNLGLYEKQCLVYNRDFYDKQSNKEYQK